MMITPFLGQVGINTATPQETLHINGSLQVTGEINVGGDGETIGNYGNSEQILMYNGSGNSPIWTDFTFPKISFNTAGTIISTGGNYIVAQEIAVQLTEDFSYNTDTIVSIPNLNTVIIDNEGTYTSDASGNSFTIKEQGVYMITLNFLVQNAKFNNNPEIGVWDNTNNGWIALTNDAFIIPETGVAIRNQNYTLITAVNLDPTHTYSFRIGDTDPFILKSSSSTGGNKVSMVTVKRLQ